MGDKTVPLAIVLYIDGSFVKHKMPIRPIYMTVQNLNLVVSTELSNTCRLHHACIAHVVDMVNSFCGEDKHILCTDGQEHTCYIHVCTWYVHVLSLYI